MSRFHFITDEPSVVVDVLVSLASASIPDRTRVDIAYDIDAALFDGDDEAALRVSNFPPSIAPEREETYWYLHGASLYHLDGEWVIEPTVANTAVLDVVCRYWKRPNELYIACPKYAPAWEEPFVYTLDGFIVGVRKEQDTFFPLPEEDSPYYRDVRMMRHHLREQCKYTLPPLYRARLVAESFERAFRSALLLRLESWKPMASSIGQREAEYWKNRYQEFEQLVHVCGVLRMQDEHWHDYLVFVSFEGMVFLPYDFEDLVHCAGADTTMIGCGNNPWDNDVDSIPVLERHHIRAGYQPPHWLPTILTI